MLELGNTYNKDCIEGLQQMINQNILVDCIITDPPMVKIIIRIEEKERYNNY